MAVGKWCKGGEGARYEICAVFRAFTQTRFSLMRRTRARTLGRGAVIISFGNRMHSDENRAFSFLSLVGGLISLKDTWDRFVDEYRKCSMRSNFFFFFDSMFSYFPSRGM